MVMFKAKFRAVPAAGQAADPEGGKPGASKSGTRQPEGGGTAGRERPERAGRALPQAPAERPR
jgi:hypothetical protein